LAEKNAASLLVLRPRQYVSFLRGQLATVRFHKGKLLPICSRHFRTI